MNQKHECDTCRYKYYGGLDEPCKRCYWDNSLPKWEPATPKEEPLAAKHGVNIHTMSKAIKGATWRHI